MHQFCRYRKTDKEPIRFVVNPVRVVEFILCLGCFGLAIYLVVDVIIIHIAFKVILAVGSAAFAAITMVDIISASHYDPIFWNSWILFACAGAITFTLCAGTLLATSTGFATMLVIGEAVNGVTAIIFLLDACFLLCLMRRQQTEPTPAVEETGEKEETSESIEDEDDKNKYSNKKPEEEEEEEEEDDDEDEDEDEESDESSGSISVSSESISDSEEEKEGDEEADEEKDDDDEEEEEEEEETSKYSRSRSFSSSFRERPPYRRSTITSYGGTFAVSRDIAPLPTPNSLYKSDVSSSPDQPQRSSNFKTQTIVVGPNGKPQLSDGTSLTPVRSVNGSIYYQTPSGMMYTSEGVPICPGRVNVARGDGMKVESLISTRSERSSIVKKTLPQETGTYETSPFGSQRNRRFSRDSVCERSEARPCECRTCGGNRQMMEKVIERNETSANGEIKETERQEKEIEEVEKEKKGKEKRKKKREGNKKGEKEKEEQEEKENEEIEIGNAEEEEEEEGENDTTCPVGPCAHGAPCGRRKKAEEEPKRNQDANAREKVRSRPRTMSNVSDTLEDYEGDPSRRKSDASGKRKNRSSIQTTSNISDPMEPYEPSKSSKRKSDASGKGKDRRSSQRTSRTSDSVAAYEPSKPSKRKSDASGKGKYGSSIQTTPKTSESIELYEPSKPSKRKSDASEKGKERRNIQRTSRTSDSVAAYEPSKPSKRKSDASGKGKDRSSIQSTSGISNTLVLYNKRISESSGRGKDRSSIQTTSRIPDTMELYDPSKSSKRTSDASRERKYIPRSPCPVEPCGLCAPCRRKLDVKGSEKKSSSFQSASIISGSVEYYEPLDSYKRKSDASGAGKVLSRTETTTKIPCPVGPCGPYTSCGRELDSNERETDSLRSPHPMDPWDPSGRRWSGQPPDYSSYCPRSPCGPCTPCAQRTMSQVHIEQRIYDKGGMAMQTIRSTESMGSATSIKTTTSRTVAISTRMIPKICPGKERCQIAPIIPETMIDSSKRGSVRSAQEDHGSLKSADRRSVRGAEEDHRFLKDADGRSVRSAEQDQRILRGADGRSVRSAEEDHGSSRGADGRSVRSAEEDHGSSRGADRRSVRSAEEDQRILRNADGRSVRSADEDHGSSRGADGRSVRSAEEDHGSSRGADRRSVRSAEEDQRILRSADGRSVRSADEDHGSSRSADRRSARSGEEDRGSLRTPQRLSIRESEEKICCPEDNMESIQQRSIRRADEHRGSLRSTQRSMRSDDEHVSWPCDDRRSVRTTEEEICCPEDNMENTQRRSVRSAEEDRESPRSSLRRSVRSAEEDQRSLQGTQRRFVRGADEEIYCSQDNVGSAQRRSVRSAEERQNSLGSSQRRSAKSPDGSGIYQQNYQRAYVEHSASSPEMHSPRRLSGASKCSDDCSFKRDLSGNMKRSLGSPKERSEIEVGQPVHQLQPISECEGESESTTWGLHTASDVSSSQLVSEIVEEIATTAMRPGRPATAPASDEVQTSETRMLRARDIENMKKKPHLPGSTDRFDPL